MRYSILIVAFLMFNLTGYSQTTSGQEDRIYWVNILSQIADPLLNSMSKGRHVQIWNINLPRSSASLQQVDMD